MPRRCTKLSLSLLTKKYLGRPTVQAGKIEIAATTFLGDFAYVFERLSFKEDSSQKVSQN